jgi:hypothetical protein
MYTANTMSSSFEALGMSLLYSSTMANPDDEKVDSAAESARVLVEAVKKDLKPRDIITRKSIENAVSLIMATGGSTNAVLHYLAIAHAAEVEWTLDDFERVRRKVPVICNLKPSGQYVATDLHKAGGVPQVMKLLLDAGLLHGDCITITGRTLAEELADVPLGQPARPGRDPPARQGAVRAGPPGHPEGQSVAGRLRGEDHGPEEPGHHRAGARVRGRVFGDGRDPGDKQDPGRRRAGAALSRARRAGRACRKCWRRPAR